MVLMNLFAGDGNGDTDIENELGDTVGEGEVDKWREQHGNIHITICKIASQGEFAARCRELKPGVL